MSNECFRQENQSTRNPPGPDNTARTVNLHRSRKRRFGVVTATLLFGTILGCAVPTRTVVVVDEHDQPIEGVRISVRTSFAERQIAVTNHDGAATFEIASTPTKLRASLSRRYLESWIEIGESPFKAVLPRNSRGAYNWWTERLDVGMTLIDARSVIVGGRLREARALSAVQELTGRPSNPDLKTVLVEWAAADMLCVIWVDSKEIVRDFYVATDVDTSRF